GGQLTHAEARSLRAVEFERANGNVRARVQVLPEHQLIIHLVNVVPGENHDVAARLAADRVEILVNGIGRAPVPVFSDAHHRRQNLNKLPQLARKYLPSLANMAVEGKGLILRENKHPAQIRIDAVGESDINDTVDSAKRNGRLGE